jgi:hypothetical protein
MIENALKYSIKNKKMSNSIIEELPIVASLITSLTNSMLIIIMFMLLSKMNKKYDEEIEKLNSKIDNPHKVQDEILTDNELYDNYKSFEVKIKSN